MESEDILNNSFTRKLIILVHEVHNNRIDKKKLELGQNNRQLLSDLEKNIIDIFAIQSKLFDTNEQLRFIPVFLQRFPDKKYLNSKGINQLSYIQYHYKVFLHKIHTILELMKLMINEVFNLKIDPKNCSWDNIKSRKELKSYKGLKILNAFYAKFKNIIELRHANTHRGEFDDSEMEELVGPLFIYESSEKYKLEMEDYNKIYPKFLLEYQIKELRKKRIKQILEMSKNSFELTQKFLLSLEDELNKKIADYHKKTIPSKNQE